MDIIQGLRGGAVGLDIINTSAAIACVGATNLDIVKVSGFGAGNAADYLTARLKRDHDDIFQRLEAGEFSSVRKAAIAAGIVKVATVLQRLLKLWEKATEADRRKFKQAI